MYRAPVAQLDRASGYEHSPCTTFSLPLLRRVLHPLISARAELLQSFGEDNRNSRYKFGTVQEGKNKTYFP
jgi:hypothetical protein